MDIEICSHRVNSSARKYASENVEVKFEDVAYLRRDDDGEEQHRLDFIFDNSKEIRYELYIMDISYFSGKIEAYFRYKRINFTRIEITYDEMYTVSYLKTGLQQVPVIHDLENDLWLRDTTSIINLIEEESLNPETDIEKGRSVLPSCPVQRFISRLLEDFADEYLWTPALYYRWNFQLDAGNLARRFTMHDFLRESSIKAPRELLQVVTIERQLHEYVEEAGIRDRKSKRYTEHIYRSVLQHLQVHFENNGQTFLLGNRPTLFDFGLFASMFRHFGLDPTPSKTMRLMAPNVYEWLGRMWNASTLSSSDSEDLHAEPGSIPYTWKPFLRLFGSDYLPYLIANAEALDSGASYFSVNSYTDIRVKPFHSWCARRLFEHWDELSEETKTEVRQILADVDCSWKKFEDSREVIFRTAEKWTAGKQVEPPNCPNAVDVPKKSFIAGLLLVVRGLLWIRARNKGSKDPLPESVKAFGYITLGILIKAKIQRRFM